MDRPRQHSGIQRHGGAALVLALILALAASFVAPARPAEALGTFQVGVDAPSITSYGWGDLRPYAPSWAVPDTLYELQRMRGSLIRVYVGNCDISDAAAASRLDSFLTQAASYGVSVIASLINEYDTCQNDQAADGYYTQPWNYLAVLNDTFFAGGYKTSFLPFVQTVVGVNRYHSNIYAWEIGNELKDPANNAHFIAFMNDVAATIKGIAPNQRVATGMLYAAHTGLTPAQLYPQLTNIDVITIHSFDGDHVGAADLDWAAQNGKVGLVEEEGISGNAFRWMTLAAEIAYFQAHGAAGLLYDGFIPQYLADTGDGDQVYGLDTIWHSDYGEVFSTLAGAAVGGQNLVLTDTSAATTQLTWTGGGEAAGFDVLRISNAGSTLLNGGPLPATTTAIADTPPASDQYDCYVVVALSSSAVLGNSDVLCRLPHIQSGPVVPSEYSIGLAQTQNAMLTWGLPVGQTGFALASLTPEAPGATWQVYTFPGNTTGVDFYDLNGQMTCYLLVAQSGTTPIGNTDVLCALPGQSSLGSGQQAAKTLSAVKARVQQAATAVQRAARTAHPAQLQRSQPPARLRIRTR